MNAVWNNGMLDNRPDEFKDTLLYGMVALLGDMVW